MSKYVPLTESQVTFTLEIEQEQDHPRGHFASGDDEADAAQVAEILERLQRGDECAWCWLQVVATAPDGTTGGASLGAVCLSDDHPWGPQLTDYVRAEFPELWFEALAELNTKCSLAHTPRVVRMCQTKYLGPTDNRVARVRARHLTTKRTATIAWDYEQDAFENHADVAARVLGRRPEFSTAVDGGGYIFGVDPRNDPTE